ncbi:MAG: ABC transporter substrate-binding protein [Thermaerobacter sp.]|nr:ABC transporter substrate-binding protein [Thermaerobacter sp.]
MRSRSARTLIAILGAVGITALVAGCSSTPAVTIPTTLRLAQASPIPTLDPASWFDGVSQGYMHAIYDTLVQYGPDNATIEPDLATSWNVTNNGKTYIFNLRKGVKFSNGDAFDAQAVQYNIQRMTSKAAGAPYAFAYSMIQGFAAWNAGTASSLTGVKVLGSHRIEFDLTAPSGTFLNAMALVSAAIGDPKAEAKYGFTSYEDNAIGTGPYVLSKWVHGQELVLTRNPHYWGRRPSIKTISTTVGLSPAQQLRDFQKGRLDIVGTFGSNGINAQTFSAIQASRSLKQRYHSAPADSVTFLGFNVTAYPFDQLAVRQAVNVILNRDALVAALTAGRGTLDNDGLFAPGMPGYNAGAVYPYSVDATKAAALLRSVGITPTHPASFELAFQSGAPTVMKAMQVVKAELQPLGLDATLKPIPWTTFFTNAHNASQTTYGMYLLTWAADYPQPEDLFDNLFATNGTANFSGFNDTALQNLLAQADMLPPSQQAQQISIYRQANQILLQQAPADFLSYGWNEVLVQPWVQYTSVGALGLGPVYTAEFADLTLRAHK